MKLVPFERFGWWARVACLAALLVTCLFGWAKIRFGSLGAARAYFRGEVVEVSFAPSEKGDASPDEGLPKAREITVGFTNNAPEAITIIGAITQCSCLKVKSLPLTLPPLSTDNRALATLSRLEGDSATATPQRVVFITDSPLMPQVVAELPAYPVAVARHHHRD